MAYLSEAQLEAPLDQLSGMGAEALTAEWSLSGRGGNASV